jgi:heptose-I-phosphate ethanolaminephosphotransferase
MMVLRKRTNGKSWALNPFAFLGITVLACFGAVSLGFIRPVDALKSCFWFLLISVLLYKVLAYFKASAQIPVFFLWLFVFFLDLSVQGVLRGFFGANPAPSIIAESIANTSSSETINFLTSQFKPIAIAVAYLICIIFVFWRARRFYFEATFKWVQNWPRWMFFFLFLVFILLHLNPTMLRQQPLLRWPVVYLRHLDAQNDINEALEMRQRIQNTQSQWDVVADSGKKTVVLVIGESDNRHNWSWHGYQRETTLPLQKKLNALGGVTTQFMLAKSAQAYTLPSLRLALTPATVSEPLLWRSQPDVFLLAKAAGYRISWFSNQVASEGWLSVLGKSADTFKFVNSGNWRDSSTTDFALLPELSKQLDSQPADKELIVLHLLGQHFHYELRCPNEPGFRPFSSINNDAVLQQMKAQGRSESIRQTRNDYDNAIYCGSMFQSKVLEAVASKRDDRLIEYVYFSDHGQEVGHTQNYAGHSDTSEQGFTVPLFLWSNSPKSNIVSDEIKIQEPYSTEHLHHLIQGVLGVQSRFYNVKLDPLYSRRLQKSTETKQ